MNLTMNIEKDFFFKVAGNLKKKSPPEAQFQMLQPHTG